MDMIYQIGGCRSVGGVGARYGEGYEFEYMSEILHKLRL